MRAKASEINIAVCQITSTDSVDANVEMIEGILRSFESPGSLDLVCFPENALYFRIREADTRIALELNDPRLQRLAKWAGQAGVTVHLGSVPLQEHGATYNASVLLTAKGEVQSVYRKIHLFDVDVEGQKSLRESDVFAHGREPSTFEIKGWKFGSSICYDVRFSELFLRYGRAEVDVILVPAAFIVPTGRAHWEILLRARAIESQAFLLAAAQAGTHVGVNGGTRETYGQSLVVDPWGQILAEGPKEAAGSHVLKVSLKAERIEAVRRQIPMKNHRRLV